MKKLFLCACMAALAASANAQVAFGIQVGGNLANLKSEFTDAGTTTKEDTKSKLGFLAGFVAELPLSGSLYFRPELNFIQKGAKVDDTSTETTGGFTSTTTTTGKTTLNFIEIPLNLVYMVPAGMGNVFLGIGPSIGFGISGKNEGTYTSTISGPGFPTETTSGSGKSDVKFDGKKDADLASTDQNLHLKSLDFGGNILAGYKMANGAYINVGYTMGFSNLDPNDNSSLKTKGFTFKLGYMLGNHKGAADKK